MTDAEDIIKMSVDPMMPRAVTVKRIVWETEDTVTLHIDMSDGSYSFSPGQFNMLYSFGAGESAISISSDPMKPGVLTHTIRKVGIVTSALSSIKKGGVIGIRGPFGSSWPMEKARGKDVCFVAGGIGLAPLKPAIYTVLKRRKEYGKIFILYGARTPRDLLYRVELEKWNKLRSVEVHTSVDRGDQSWKGNVGVVSALFQYVKINPANTVTMICGPEAMMYYSLKDVIERGQDASNIYLSLERNMKCGVGSCGHCQFGPKFICKDGPVFSYPQIKELFGKKEL